MEKLSQENLLKSKNEISFDNLDPNLSDESKKAVASFGFLQMTPVQAATIPLFLTNKDVCVEAVTGSGKTLAYLLPAVEMVQRRTPPLSSLHLGALIVAPTRELARQVFTVAEKICSFHAGRVVPQLCIGGTKVAEDLQAYQENNTNVLIGTPGRIEDLLKNYDFINTKDLEVLILDEADTLLDMGFATTLDTIFSLLPKQRRTGLFSATQTKEVRELARAGLRNPALVSVAVRNEMNHRVQTTPSTLTNHYLLCSTEAKLAQLLAFLQTVRGQKVMVFYLTCACVDFFGAVLSHLVSEESGGKVLSLHGRMVQKKRQGIYQQFQDMESGILVCTDVAARGIDVPDVKWIVQYDPPQDPNFFVHRVGRTARAGQTGKSLTLLLPHEDSYIEFLKLRKVPLQEMPAFGTMSNPISKIKKMALSDRDLLEKGSGAFTSFVRAYKEHQCNYIFQFKKLDLGAVARSFCLLKLPKMAETVNIKTDFEAADVDFTAIPYKDKKREAARLKRLEKQREEMEIKKKKKQQLQKDNEKGKRKDKKMQNDEVPKKRKGKHQKILEEWDELANEERLFKKLKRGKITKEQYEIEMSSIYEHEESSGDKSEDDEADQMTGKKKSKGTKKKLKKGQRNSKKRNNKFKAKGFS